MTVTDIIEYKKGKYRICLNDEFAFVLYTSELKDHGIKAGAELSEASYEAIVNNVLKKRCRAYALHILKKQDRTVRELRSKLSEALYPEEVIDDALSYVSSLHYVDDVRYSENYIRSVCGRLSLFEIKTKLLSKGVAAEDIESAIENCRDENILDEDTETGLLKKLLLKKLRSFEGKPDDREKERIFASLYRKGFRLSDIERVYEEIGGDMFYLT
ncbi:MAG: RecX family transcriptional regulator [Lachnospiraceae bacterium]|nr:RecX family transcriptional regulator [Lachnospiraceae bacterium]